MAVIFTLMMGGIGVAFAVALIVSFKTGRIGDFFGVFFLMLLVVGGVFYFFFEGITRINL